MKHPTVTTQWRKLGIEAAVDEDGILHTTVHFLELTTGLEFTLSVSGKKTASVTYWIGALRALLSAWETAAGVPNTQNVQLIDRPANH